MIAKAFSNEYFQELLVIRKRNILFFNGCFDIIHPGHIHLINQIKKYGRDTYSGNGFILVCGINSDESVKKQNKSHPLINNENERAYFLEKLGVDSVFIFDDEMPTSLIMSLMPNKIFKGWEYAEKDFHEKEFCNIAGIDIRYVDNIKGFSTTNIYNKIYDVAKEDIAKKIMG